jgi:hypothetical protein
METPISSQIAQQADLLVEATASNMETFVSNRPSLSYQNTTNAVSSTTANRARNGFQPTIPIEGLGDDSSIGKSESSSDLIRRRLSLV